jgi:outer membrane lipase/esterase
MAPLPTAATRTDTIEQSKKGEEMITSIFNKFFKVSALLVVLLMPRGSEAIEFKSIVVFGGSISDPGNFFALFGISNKPPYTFDQLDETLVSTGPYSKGGHHFSNGPTWIEELGKTLGLNKDVQAAFKGSNPHATNYAVGGARSVDIEVPFDTIDLPEQVGAFLAERGNVAPADALYVIDFGGNDVRDALGLLAVGDIVGAQQLIQNAIGSIALHVNFLLNAGATKFLFVNVANIGRLPSVLRLNDPAAAGAATALTLVFNDALESLIITPLSQAAEVAVLDVFGTVEDLVGNPSEFGLTEVEQACITPNVPPFSCKKPDQFLFWDGVHPTKAVHEIFADVAFDVLNPVVAKK